VKTRIGFYVHHHGLGHAMRASAILSHLRSEATVLTSLQSGIEGAAIVPLPMDTGPLTSKGAARVPLHRGLHYAPIGCPGLTERMAAIASWAALWRPDLILVDVSVEVAVFARLCGLPVVIVRQHGERDDPAHLLAYECAVSLLAPYPESFEEPSTPGWVRRRTMYVGGFSRFDDRSGQEPRIAVPEGKPSVLVMAGGGGPGADLDLVEAAATATPGWCWTVIGPASGNVHRLVRHSPWVGDPYPHLVAADVVVTAAGDNAVAEVAAAGRPLISIPEERPYNEQRSKAAVLRRAEAALVLPEWPEPGRWPDLLERALKLGPSGLKKLVDGRGAARAAACLDELAQEFHPQISRDPIPFSPPFPTPESWRRATNGGGLRPDAIRSDACRQTPRATPSSANDPTSRESAERFARWLRDAEEADRPSRDVGERQLRS
jgi:hypothetical protein